MNRGSVGCHKTAKFQKHHLFVGTITPATFYFGNWRAKCSENSKHNIDIQLLIVIDLPNQLHVRDFQKWGGLTEDREQGNLQSISRAWKKIAKELECRLFCAFPSMSRSRLDFERRFKRFLNFPDLRREFRSIEADGR